MRSATGRIPAPKLLTVRQVQGFVRLSYRGTLRLIARRLKPLGAVIECPGGRTYHVLVHAWGVAKLLQPGTHCPACGRVAGLQGQPRGRETDKLTVHAPSPQTA